MRCWWWIKRGILKQGKASCGVARQYAGSAGKTANCHIGVFASDVSRHGHAFIDRALYLPKRWSDDPDRLKATRAPSDVGFATKPQLAAGTIERALTAPCTVSLGRGRYRLWRRRHRARAAPDRQRIRARRQFGALVWIVEQAATTRRLRGRDRRNAGTR